MPGDIPRLLPEGSPRLLEVPLFEGTDIFIAEATYRVYVRRLFGLSWLLRSWRYGYRSHLLLNKWWDWWSKLIHIGCKAGSACSGRTLKMVPENAPHRALLALLSGRLVYVDLASFIGLLIGPDWMG